MHPDAFLVAGKWQRLSYVQFDALRLIRKYGRALYGGDAIPKRTADALARKGFIRIEEQPFLQANPDLGTRVYCIANA